jgi:opacity protein-like surface antigen
MERGKTKLFVLFTAMNVASLCGAGTVMAEAEPPRLNYAQIKLGMYQPTGDVDDADYDSGATFGVVYGRYLNRYLVFEAGFDVFGADRTVRGANDQAGAYTQDNTLVGVGGLLTLKGEYAAGPLALFAGIGGGIYAVTLTSEIESSRLGDFDSDDSDGVFGAHVTAGVTYNINERFFLGLEGRYRWTEDVDIRETVASVPVEYSGDLSGYTITFNGGFRF